MADYSPMEVMTSIFWYTVCSSLMLMVNKMAVTYIPLPATVAALQLLAAVVFVVVLRTLGALKADSLQKDKCIGFMPYIVAFCASLYANGKALQFANMETVIVFRAAAPLFVCGLEWLLMGRELPSWRSASALGGVVVGSMGYMAADSEFSMSGLTAYFWVTIYLVLLVFLMVYGKKLMSGIGFDTPVWGSVYYNNALSLPPMMLTMLLSGEATQLANQEVGAEVEGGVGAFGLLVVAVSCVIGIGISWAGWNCREKTSATTFTLVGVACKFLSVLMNVFVWDKHASPLGLFWLTVCLIASAFYKQPPMRESDSLTAPNMIFSKFFSGYKVVSMELEKAESSEP